jgi:hypothetical protein
MLDQAIFKSAWAILCERFDRQRSDTLMMAYYKVLAPQLSTSQFQAACARIFVDREFFPRPADFLAEVRPDPKADALEQWVQVHELMRGFGDRHALDPAATRAVAMLGGMSKLRNTPLDSVQWVRRDFLQLYGDVAHQPLIAPTPEGLRLTARIMDEAPIPHGAAFAREAIRRLKARDEAG